VRESALVVVDPERGHITVGDLTFCDLNSVLSVWSYSGATLTPETARDLGMALLTWSADTMFAEGMAQQ
jgi:hypothetical protein